MNQRQKVAAVKEALQNSRDNGYDPDSQSAEQVAVDLWMDYECEKIEYEERLQIVLSLRKGG